MYECMCDKIDTDFQYSCMTTGGSNISMLRRACPGSFFQLTGRRGGGRLAVYAENEAVMKKVILLLRPYK